MVTWGYLFLSIMKVFITFGSSKWYKALHRICQEARAFPFDKIRGFTDQDLKEDPVFWGKHGDFVTQNPKGYGFWIWKPYLIQQTLRTLEDGDILVYADCGCELNPQGMDRFQEYMDVLEMSDLGIISFQMDHLDRDFTKKIILDHFQNDGSTGQYVGGIQLIKKTPHSVKVIDKWVQMMYYDWINDTPDSYASPRNDQSIYSMVVKKYGTIRLPDETYFLDWSEGKHIPILAKRNKYA